MAKHLSEVSQDQETATATATASLSLSDLVFPIAGGYYTFPLPTIDPASSTAQSVLAYGLWKYLLTALQPVVEKAVKDGKDPQAVVLAYAKKFSVEDKISARQVPNLERDRLDVAEALCRAKLTEMGKLTGTAEVNDIIVTKSLPNFVAKFGDAIDSALYAKLAAGYTPKKKGTTVTAATAEVVEAVDF